MSNIFTHWKTTVSGIMSFVIAAAGVTTSYAAAQLAVNPASGKTLVTVSGISTLAAGIAKAVIGAISQDAGTTQAVVPGQPGIQTVPSHEVPNDPQAIAVPKEPSK